ncbi:hypothetical protein [Fluviicola taffensis]|uniref:Uncharacterized protein n=1 Tax=Fluviicola taffensis (strain DSM 16823 / NCIMB 13979 / RW262) TaxID=755732 RepID=F2IGK1_FLUTR|nr:hypothetical protein [Fluviicola taffensis]AEA42607.1 hypothetical protein Fluta_0603 [Fluviicola taffensis DSM 16823]
MKKSLYILVFTFISGLAYSQTTVFELNQEKARYNEFKQVSHIVNHVFIPQGTVNASQYAEICSIMNQKDGYVSCNLNPQNQLVIQHEDWLNTKDIIDVIKSVIPVDLKKETEEPALEHLSK